MWQKAVKRTKEMLGFTASILQPAVYVHRERNLEIVAHVDDFLCAGRKEDLDLFREGLTAFFDISATYFGPEDEHTVKYLNRVLRWTSSCIEYECDPKHCQTLLKEWCMNECRPMDSPMSRDTEDRLGDGEVVNVQDSQRARRAIARLNCMAQDRPDLRVCCRQLSQRKSSPVTGTVTGIKHVLRYLKNYPRGWTCYAWDNR